METPVFLDIDFENDNQEIPITTDPDETRPSFPSSLIPEVIRGPIRELENQYGVEPDLPAIMSLGAISAVLGKGLRLKTRRHLTAPNLYCLASAPSGTGKSICFKRLMQPINEVEHERLDEYNRSRKANLLAEKELIEAKISSIRRSKSHGSNELVELTKHKKRLLEIDATIGGPRLHTDDVTVQQLALMLSQQNETMACLSSEAGELISIMQGRYNKKERTDEHFFLKAFSLDGHTQDRVQRDSVILREPCLTITAVCTPDELEDLFSNRRFVQGGLLPRFLFCRSKSKPKYDDGSLAHSDEQLWQTWDTLLRELLLNYHDAQGHHSVECSPEAQQVFVDMHNSFVDGSFSAPERCSFDCRLSENAMKIALCLHAATYGKEAHLKQLEFPEAHTAAELVRYFASTTDHFLDAQATRKDDEDIMKIMESMQGAEASIRDLKRRGMDFDRIMLLVRRYPDRLEYSEIANPKGGPHKRIIRFVFQGQ